MKNEKKVMLLSLTILAVLLTGFTWAYWNSGTIKADDVKSQSNTIQIGTGESQTVETVLEVGNSQSDHKGKFVPATIDPDNSTVKFTYDISWSTDSKYIDYAVGKIDIKNFKFDIPGVEDKEEVEAITNDLFKYSFEVSEKRLGENMTMINSGTQLYLTIIFENEPTSKEIYDLIQGKQLVASFDIQIIPEN